MSNVLTVLPAAPSTSSPILHEEEEDMVEETISSRGGSVQKTHGSVRTSVWTLRFGTFSVQCRKNNLLPMILISL